MKNFLSSKFKRPSANLSPRLRRAGQAASVAAALGALFWTASAHAAPATVNPASASAAASTPLSTPQSGSAARGGIAVKKASIAQPDPDRGPGMQSQFDADWAKGQKDAGLSQPGAKPAAAGVFSAPARAPASGPKAPPGFSDRSVMAFPYGADLAQTVDFYVSAQPIPDAPLAFLVPATAGPSEAQSPAERAALVAQARHWTDEGFVAVVGWRRAGPKATPAEQAKDVAAALEVAQKNAKMVNLDPARTVIVAEGVGAKVAIDALGLFGKDRNDAEKAAFLPLRGLVLAGGEGLSGVKADGVKTLSTGSLPGSSAAIDQFVSGLGL